jgi:serine protease AprX
MRIEARAAGMGKESADGGRLGRRVLAGAIVAALLALPTAAAQAAPAPVEVLVVAQHDRAAAAQRLTERLGGAVEHGLTIVDGFTARVPRAALARLASSSSVRAVSRDGGLKLSTTDPGAAQAAASSQLVQTAIGAGGSRFDGAGVGVALLDSGVVELGGLERPGTVVHGPDFSGDSADPDLAGLDTFGHGSHVAGLIAGHDPLSGFEGVAPGARIVSVKVAGADGVTSLAQVLLGMDWIHAHRRDLNIRVLNLSLGTDEGVDYRRDILAWAAEALWSDGIAVVASAGNRGEDAESLDLPAADPFVIAAGASDTRGTPDPADDTVADFSNRSAVRPPDVLAPGTGIVSLRVPGSTLDTEFEGARVGDGFFRGSGTSQATAIVSGVAARLLSQRPGLSNDQLKALLTAGAVDVPGDGAATGAGRVDLGRSAALDPLPRGRAKQRFAVAAPDLRGGNGRELGSGDLELWAGRRWSGMKWAGRRWSGMKWAGMKWNGAAWDDGAPAG